jgi:hypothetical protein
VLDNSVTKEHIWLRGNAVIGGGSSFVFLANYYYKSRKRWGQHVTRIGEKGLKSGSRKPERKRGLGSPRRRWADRCGLD